MENFSLLTGRRPAGQKSFWPEFGRADEKILAKVVYNLLDKL